MSLEIKEVQQNTMHEGTSKGSPVYRDVTISRSCGSSSSKQTGKLVAKGAVAYTASIKYRVLKKSLATRNE